jgi:hypothetical protein
MASERIKGVVARVGSGATLAVDTRSSSGDFIGQI